MSGRARVPSAARWFARGVLLLVLSINLSAALGYLITPELYVRGFELEGVPGQTVVRGIGVFILLWMVPYPLAIYDPAKHVVSFSYALVSQLLGVGLESWLYAGLPAGHETLRATGLRYIAVDGLGLLLLSASFLALHMLNGRRPGRSQE